MICAEYLQDLIYKLSKVGQAIENNDLPTAGSVLGQSSDSEWVRNANAALTKVSYGSTFSLIYPCIIFT